MSHQMTPQEAIEKVRRALELGSQVEDVEADDALQALTVIEQNMLPEWQDISTAPKDGTKIDLLYPYPRGRRINCYWKNAPFYTWVWKEPRWDDNDNVLPEEDWPTSCLPNMRPTHWMYSLPLPTPPKNREIEG